MVTVRSHRQSRQSRPIILLPWCCCVPLVRIVAVVFIGSFWMQLLRHYDPGVSSPAPAIAEKSNNDFSLAVPGFASVVGGIGRTGIRGATRDGATSASLFRRTSGDGWSMWDGSMDASTWVDFECANATYRVLNQQGNEVTANMCVHKDANVTMATRRGSIEEPDNDYISNHIMQHGVWEECEVIRRIWSQRVGKHNPNGIYVDIGANVGSCVVHMLLATQARIVAFEPHVKNVFCLASTLTRMDEAYRNRVSLFPLGLGEMNLTASSARYAAGNYGAAMVVDLIPPDNDRDYGKRPRFEIDSTVVKVESADSIFAEEVPVLDFVKIDVQGYECKVIEGMKDLLKRVPIVFSEVEERFMSTSGCSPEKLFRLLNEFQGGVIYSDRNETLPIFEPLKNIPMYNIISVANDS